MSDTQPNTPDPEADGIPVARVKARRFSLVWLIPLAAVLGLAGLLVHQLNRERGPIITITFTQAEGLQTGAEIVHRGIAVGVVREVRLAPDLAAVRVRAELDPSARGLAREGATFWVVRPELSLTRVSGLETILGPRYIAVTPPPPDAPTTRAFTGLDTPPRDPDRDAAGSSDGLLLTLTAPHAGTIAPGSPVVYRGIPVGSVRSLELAEDATAVLVTASVDPSYATLVRDNTRFWLTSGVGVDFGLFSGLSVRADSLESLLQGSVAFATPDRPGQRVGPGHRFELEPEPESRWLEWDPAITIRESED